MFLAFSIHFQQVSVLFVVTLLLRLYSLASNSVFATKFSRDNLALTTSAAKVLKSGVVVYLSWLWSVSSFSGSLIFLP